MEKRLYPRIEKQFSAIVENKDGVQLKVMAVDTSSNGVCIQCNTFDRNLITPGGNFVDNSDGKPVELFLWLDLPFEGEAVKKIGARCHVVFSRRISRDQCKIGMRYMNLDDTAYETIVKFIEAATASTDC